MSAIAPIAGYAAKAAFFPIASALANPVVTTVALGILGLSYLPKAEAGILSYMACYSSCMVASNTATSGAMLLATQMFCQELCLPLLAAPTP